MKIDLTQTHDVDGAYQSIDWTEIKNKYKDPGTRYCFDVLDKKILAGYDIKLACFRHLRDLQRQKNQDFPYHYSIEEVQKILKFASVCPEVKTKKPVKLMSWQKFVLSMLIGWRNQIDDKRFTRAIVSVARHNGKTYLMSIITIYSYLIESLGESSQDFLVSSINAKQTSKLMSYVKQMLINLSTKPPFQSLIEDLGINQKSLASQSEIVVSPKTFNKIVAVTYESGQYDTNHYKTAIGDEFADPKVDTTDKISRITSGQVDVSNKQFIQISTAYENPTVPFRKDEKNIIHAMEKDSERSGDTYLVLNWSQDNENEIYSPETWEKSNPLLGMPEKREKLRLDLQNERDDALMSGDLVKYQNKSMNVWTKQSTASFLNLKDIENAIDDDFNIDNRQVYIGLDYSMFSDNTAIGFVYPYQNSEGQPRWHVAQHSFIPWQQAGSLEAKERQDGIAYREFPEYCSITAHPKGVINPEQVYRWLLNYVEQHNLKVIFLGYDRWGSYQVQNVIESLNSNTGWLIQDVAQVTTKLTNPTKFLQENFITGKITRFNDPILEKALINASIKEDKVGIQVVKDKATFKIDVVDALIDAMYQGMNHFEEYGLINDKSTEVDRMTEDQVLEWFKDPDSGLLGDEDDDW